MFHPWLGKINKKVYESREFVSPFPVDLNKINFDQEELGESERNFEKRIKSLEKDSYNRC
jgi:hypothetical protein